MAVGGNRALPTLARHFSLLPVAAASLRRPGYFGLAATTAHDHEAPQGAVPLHSVADLQHR